MKYKDLTNLPFFQVDSDRDKNLLLLKEPPEEIVETTFNEVTGEEYKHIPIETLEAMLDYFFGVNGHSFQYKFKINNNGLITVKGELNLGNFFGSGFYSCFWGSAVRTVKPKAIIVKDYTGENVPIILSADEQMRTALPLTVTEAKKNAIKNVANLFGRNLNRGEQKLSSGLKLAFPVGGNKMKPDTIIIQKYKVAEKQKDTNTLAELSALYDFSSYIDEFKKDKKVDSVTGSTKKADKKVKKSKKKEVKDAPNK